MNKPIKINLKSEEEQVSDFRILSTAVQKN